MRLWADVVISYTSIGENPSCLKGKRRMSKGGRERAGSFHTINVREIRLIHALFLGTRIGSSFCCFTD